MTENAHLFYYPTYDIVRAVTSSEELQEVVFALHDKYGLAGSTWDWKGAKLVGPTGAVYRVSYNSRTWKNEDTPYTF